MWALQQNRALYCESKINDNEGLCFDVHAKDFLKIKRQFFKVYNPNFQEE